MGSKYINKIMKFLFFIIFISVNGISKDFEARDVLSSGINYRDREYGCFSGKIEKEYNKKFELVKFEGKVCRNIVDYNTSRILIGSMLDNGDFIYDKDDIKILSRFDVIKKGNNTKIEEKIKFIQLLSLIKSEKYNIRFRSNSTMDLIAIPETNYHFIYSEYISFQFGYRREVIDLVDFFFKGYNPDNSRILKNLELVEMLEKNYDTSKTEFNNEEIGIIYKIDEYTIEQILHKNIIELYLMLEKGSDAELKF